MDCDEVDNANAQPEPGEEDTRSAVNSLILDYYKKFGRKRDLEQYFSLSTAQTDIRDPTSSFWMNMKTEESEDSGERSDKKSESSHELCRISIRCSVPDPSSTSQDEDSKAKTESVSPPIIIEEISHDSRNSEDDVLKSDDNHSQKSFDVMLDTSTNKPLSPSSSITSQRKLEWDSLADVGYANESDRKTSASSLSTLERLALKQQYSNNDTQPSDIGAPTSHSTPLEDDRPKNRKGIGKKSTKIHKKDVDFLEVNVPHSSNTSSSINVNLTKHISFNVEKDGKVTVGSVQKDVSVSPEKAPIEEEPGMERIDKEIQTSLSKTKESNREALKTDAQSQKIPILIGLNTLRRTRRKRLRIARRKLKIKKKPDKANTSGRDRTVAEQVSEAESFEYMPGHIYNQNHMSGNEVLSANVAGNKSSLESSAAHTTDSSKGSKHSFTRDLEKGVDILKNALQNRCDDKELKKKLIKEVCKRLLNSQYRDDDSTTDFLSGLSFGSKKLGLDHHTTETSTSEGNNSVEKSKRPKKSILRVDKFNAGSIASTSQSAPNLPIASKSDKLVTSNLAKSFISSNTDSDMSSKDKTSSDNTASKVTSEVLYQKYLNALKREEAYKRHLKDKEMFLKQKLVSSDSAFQIPARVEVKANNRLKDLINDLTRNNYDDGSGDASKLEGGPSSIRNYESLVPSRNQRSHSVFTLSSGNSDHQKKHNLKKRLQCEVIDLSKPGTSNETEKHYCCCPHHTGVGKIAVADSCVQVNMKQPCINENCPAKQRISPRQAQMEDPVNTDGQTNEGLFGNIKFVCHCQSKNTNNVLIYKKSPQVPLDIQPSEPSSHLILHPCNSQTCPHNFKDIYDDKSSEINKNQLNRKPAKSSQTNMLLKLLRRKSSDPSVSNSMGRSQEGSDGNFTNVILTSGQSLTIYESTRCIQTEISIDPRIAEPTLSDINIVNECVKVISEHCRKSPKPSITDLYIPQIDAETCTNSDSIKSSGTSNKEGAEYLDDVKSQTNEVCETYDMESHNSNNNRRPENFTIPIQGTNMMLKVSVGAERYEIVGRKTEGFVPVSGSDQTNVSVECFKEDQSVKGGVDYNSNRMRSTTEAKTVYDTNPITAMAHNRDAQSFAIYEKVNDRSAQTDNSNKRDAQTQENVPIETQTSEYLPEQKSKCQDVTKNTQCNAVLHDQKEIRMEEKTTDKCSCGCNGIQENCRINCAGCIEKLKESNEMIVQTSSILDQQLNSQINKVIENPGQQPEKLCGKHSGDKKLSSQTLSKNSKGQCPCACGGFKENCQEDCAELIRKPSGKRLVDTRIGTYDFMKELNKNCLCGCEGIKMNCQKNCSSYRGTPGEPCADQKYNKESSSSDLFEEMEIEKCPCGCGATKDICSKDCVGRTNLSGEPCVREPVKNPCKIQGSLDKTGENCSCGCAGIIDDCSEDCAVINLIQRKPCTQTVPSSNTGEKCMCGCGGTKNNCQKNCIDIIVTPGKGCTKQSESRKLRSRNDSLNNRKQSLEDESCGTIDPVDKVYEGFCQKDSVEHKSSVSEVIPSKLKSNKLLETHEQETKTTEDCPCGCGNLRDNCKENCIYSKTAKSSFGNCVDKIDVGIQKNFTLDHSKPNQVSIKTLGSPNECDSLNSYKSISKDIEKVNSRKENSDIKPRYKSKKHSSGAEETNNGSDPILKLIQDITRRYSKNDIEKNKRKKCFTEIVVALNYLLETDDCNEGMGKMTGSSTPDDSDLSNKKVADKPCKLLSQKSSSKKLADKVAPLPHKPSKTRASITQCSEIPTSTENPATSSDSAACKILNKIKKECDKYHQKRCKVHCGKKCDASSSTSVNCEQCRRIHHCSCRSHKCKSPKKSMEKIQKGPIAYNLILQTSESVMSESAVCNEKSCQLKNIIVKVPKRKPIENIPFKEMATKFERNMSPSSPRNLKSCRSRSLPNESEISSMDEIMRKSRGCTVREYLEKNRPDFVERSSQRQNCLKYISERREPDPCTCAPSLKMVVVHAPNCMECSNMFCTGMPMCQPQMNNQCYDSGVTAYQSGLANWIGEFCANERAVQRDLLAMYMSELPDVTTLDSDGLRKLASDLGHFIRKQKPAPKLISEREMKKRSEKIYKSLPEVVQKKEEIKKENIKKTNLLMASIFKKNLQKKTLGGSVNISNYSTVVQI